MDSSARVGPSPPMNFAAGLPGWTAFVAESSALKKPLPPRINEALMRYLAGTAAGDAHGQKGASLTAGTTFYHFINYFNSGLEGVRLEVACCDFGYTVAELRDLRDAGGTCRDIAFEIVNRALETPRDEAPRAETPRAETPRDEAPRAETPRAEAPRAETTR